MELTSGVSLIDLRVQTLTGYYYYSPTPFNQIFVSEVSEWSEPITVSIPPADEAGTWTYASKEPQTSQHKDLENIVLLLLQYVLPL
ncbi:MAG: hypothetical protein LBE76_01660 [Nitrososphaerota archaeon]|jgi:hypothetical protein|nr:hypothetical protein [Nitrososphaerota archaeon]